MELATYFYSPNSGWSQGLEPSLDSDQTLVVVFGASDLSGVAGAVAELADVYASSHFIGCSTAGEIYDTTLSDGGLTVAVARFSRTRLSTVSAQVSASEESFSAGAQIARGLKADDLRGVFVLSEGLSVNGSELVRGINSVLPEDVVVTGGLAADGDRFQETWTLAGGAAHPHRVCAVGFYGDAVRIGHGSKGGWDRFGVEREVTHSEGNVLYELDGRPALSLYKEYLGERAQGLPATGLLFPLSLRSGPNDQDAVVRTILAVDESNQSITFAGDIPESSLATLMHANFDRLVNGASDAASMIDTLAAGGLPTLALAISCVGRRLVLGEGAEEEIEATLDVLPSNTRQVGFYSYGEISPHTSGRCDLHNQTMTLTTIAEV